MNRNTIRLFTAACAAVLLVSACGDGTDASSGADTAIGQALTQELMSDGDSPIGTEEQARCMAGDIVDNIGEDRLTELGVTEDNVGSIDEIDFSEGEVDTIVDSMFDCVDVRAAMAEEFVADFGEEGASCLADNLPEDFLRTAMASGLTGSEDVDGEADFFQAMLDVAAECDLDVFG
ncbi:MAG: hypothetical protein AAGA93_12225 [Actinomycetota bacterium]